MPFFSSSALVFHAPAGRAPGGSLPYGRPAAAPAGTIRRFELALAVRDSLGPPRGFAYVLGLPDAAAWQLQVQLAGQISRELDDAGFTPKEVKCLVRKAKRVDGATRFCHAAAISLVTTVPVAVAAAAGALVGSAVGGACGGWGALVGAPIGAFAAAVPVALAAAPVSTALYRLDAAHRSGVGGEFTWRGIRSLAGARAVNALAYGGGALVANAPLITAQAATATVMAASLATTGVWAGLGMAVAPVAGVAATGVRVAIQERMNSRRAGPMFGLTSGGQGGAALTWDRLLMQQRLEALRSRSTASLVLTDLQRFGKRVCEELPSELRRAVRPGGGLAQTALNATLLVGAQALGGAVAGGLAASGVAGGFAAAAGRGAGGVPGAVAWGAGRPVSRPARRLSTGPAL